MVHETTPRRQCFTGPTLSPRSTGVFAPRRRERSCRSAFWSIRGEKRGKKRRERWRRRMFQGWGRCSKERGWGGGGGRGGVCHRVEHCLRRRHDSPWQQSGAGAVAASHEASLFTAALVVWGGARTSKLSPRHTVHCACAHTYVLLCTLFICYDFLKPFFGFLCSVCFFYIPFFGICFRFPFSSLESRKICR